MIILLLLLVFWTGICGGQPAERTGASIRGTLSGDGLSLAGSLILKKVAPIGGKRTEWNATSSADGSFSFDSLPDGEFVLCAQVPLGDWLNPCEWAQTRPTVVVARGRRQVVQAINLERGIWVSIRFEDVAGEFSRAVKKPEILVGISSEGAPFRPAQVNAEGPTERSYRVLVPRERQIRVVVGSSALKLSNSLGVPLARGSFASVPVRLLAGQIAAAPIHFIVTGGY